MKQLLIVIFSLPMMACGSSKTIHIDMENYVGLEDDSNYRMIITNPNDADFADTTYWQGTKFLEYDLKNDKSEFLAFVEVAKMDDYDDVDEILFRSVVALDANNITIKAFKKDSVVLSGSESNRNITNFRYGRYEEFAQNDFKEGDIYEFCLNEVRKHQTDLYGAYIYSCGAIVYMFSTSSDEDIPPYMVGDRLLKDIIQYDYISSHNIAVPFIEVIRTLGDIPPTLVFEYLSYMISF